jgi:flagellar basal-body rod protein FlgB
VVNQFSGTEFANRRFVVFINRLVNQGNTPLVERMVSFTQKRHELILENLANVSTPGYEQKDLDLDKFQKSLRERVALREKYGPGQVNFGDISGDIENPQSGILFHDRNNRSMEGLMANLSSNGLRHQMYVELLRKQYNSMQSALKERVE